MEDKLALIIQNLQEVTLYRLRLDNGGIGSVQLRYSWQISPIELVRYRAEYYRYVITSLLKAVRVPIDRLEFVLGSSYQVTPEYTMDLFRLSSVVTEHDAKKAGAEVVNPLASTLDEPDDSWSARRQDIDLLETVDAVRKKLRKAYAPPLETEGNGTLSFTEFVLLPAGFLKYGEQKFVVERRDAEPLVYTDIKQMHEDYKNDILSPQLLKPAVTGALISLLEPIQAEFQASKEWQEIEEKAYPPPPVEEKKKQRKDKGSRYPGGAAAKNVETQPDGSVEGKDKMKLV
ncbi:Nucleotidylyl transferase [Cenococcum geophilum]